MGGPSRESYRRAEERKQARLAALRTRDGVVDLAEWRKVLPVQAWLEGHVGDFPAVLRVRLAPAPHVGFVVRVVLVTDSEAVRMALPTAVDDVPVEVVVLNAA
jgi:hypothetical protein